MYKCFKDIVTEAAKRGPYKICVAAAGDLELLKAIKMAVDLNFIEPILVGDKNVIHQYIQQIGLSGAEIVSALSDEEAVAKAVEIVKIGKADILMKGLVNTSIYMRGILNRENGLRTGRLISMLAVYEFEAYHKLIYCTDSGINNAPNLEEKKVILQNALDAMKGIGFNNPKVAALAANEMVSPSIQATVDADGLVEAVKRGEISPCLIEGPIAFDVAFSQYAAEHKGIISNISGDVDLLVFPNIETGNVLGKSWLHFNKAKWAGIVLGASRPIILGSRSDTADIKINSIALACLATNREEK
jgi:phosphate butyryltransferase